jgi:5-methylcytosine-specific restriction endonuclease McrA
MTIAAQGGEFPDLRQRIVELRAQRRMRKLANRGATRSRASLTRAQRAEVLAKTSGHCHICGGEIGSDRWQADHVLAYSGGGPHRLDNYLPAHAVCNNYRWDYLPEESQLVMKLGVFVKTQIERSTLLGRAVGLAFTAYERKRLRRQKSARRRIKQSETTS